MNNLTIFTLDTTGIKDEPVRIAVAAYTYDQALRALTEFTPKASGRTLLMKKYQHMPKSIQKQYKSLANNELIVHCWNFTSQTWTFI